MFLTTFQLLELNKTADASLYSAFATAANTIQSNIEWTSVYLDDITTWISTELDNNNNDDNDDDDNDNDNDGDDDGSDDEGGASNISTSLSLLVVLLFGTIWWQQP